MISSYEIRENSLTRNSVFLLLVKADNQGRDDIQRDLSSFCKLIDAKVKGFDYVFELSGITDDTMLEKIKTKLEMLSSSVSGSTQTFGNNAKTKIVDISSQTEQNIQEQKGGTVTLANSGFSVEKEKREEVSFEEITANSSLVSGDEKSIEIGNTSLKLVRTVPNMKEEMPVSFPTVQEIKTKGLENEQEKNNIEEVNRTAVPNIETKIEEKPVTTEKEKKSLFKNIFGKIKSAISSDKPEEKTEKPVTEKKEPSVVLANKTEDIKPKESINVKTNNIKNENEQMRNENPFENLGEGLITKKGKETEVSLNATNQDKQEFTERSLTAKLQVDDIFAAETICDFYANQPEGQKQEKTITSEPIKTPLEILENSGKEKNEGKVFPAKPVQEAKVVSEKIDSKEPIIKQEETSKEENKVDSADITLPDQVFTQQKFPQEKEPLQEGKEHSAHKEVKTDFAQEQLVKAPKEGAEKPLDKKEEKDIFDEKKDENSQQQSAKKIKEEIIIKQENKERSEVKMQNEEKEKMNTLSEEENKNMKDEHTVDPLDKTASSISNRGILNQSDKVKSGAKIDHTLHVATPGKSAKYKNYPIEMPLIPTYTFANMDISAIRFAHAIAMATLEDLGKSNNPLVLQGVGGTGKTHFLHAMGYEISKKIPQEKILFTNGVRLSRGIQYSLEKGEKDKLDKFFNNAEVLIIDDIHLTAVNEHNREYISKVLNDFLKNKKQIILSSKYPPESLKRFEELVNFKFSVGSIAELKVPNKNHFVRLANKIVNESFLDLTEKEVQSFFCEQNNSLGAVARDVKRVKVLSRRIESSGIKKLSYEEILKEMTAINGENENSEISKKDFDEITSLERNKGGSWGNFGFFFPVSNIDKFRWVAFAAQEAAKDLGIKGGFNYALKSAYSTEHIISAAFKIANICDLKGLKGAVILGPAFMECKEPIRDNFYDILTHMLEIMMIRCGTINFEDIKKPSAYVKMLGDILK